VFAATFLSRPRNRVARPVLPDDEPIMVRRLSRFLFSKQLETAVRGARVVLRAGVAAQLKMSGDVLLRPLVVCLRCCVRTSDLGCVLVGSTLVAMLMCAVCVIGWLQTSQPAQYHTQGAGGADPGRP